MEGAHHYKAIKFASKITNYISKNLKISFLYCVSDNPSYSVKISVSDDLGAQGVELTHVISDVILTQPIN